MLLGGPSSGLHVVVIVAVVVFFINGLLYEILL